MLTSRTYPLLFTESLRVDNVQSVSDINLRTLHHKVSPETQNMAMSNPKVTSLSIRSLYNSFRQAPTDFIKLLKPRVLSLSIHNLYNRLTPDRDSISITLPTISSVGVKVSLQKLRTWGSDETITVSLPNNIEIHKKDVVNSYDNPDSIDFKIGLPDGIALGGSVKPVLTFPVLVGETTEINNTLGIRISWDDSSITHSGYTIYRSLEPIPVDTTQEPYIQLGRDIKQFDDLAVDENTTYFYRVTPKTVYGNLFSNLLSLHVPLYLRAPRNFEVGFQGLSLPINGMGDINTLSKIWTTELSFLSTEKASSVSGEYAYQIFIEDPLYRVAMVESPYELSGTSKLEHVLRGESSKYTSLQNTQDNFVEFFNDVSLYGVETKLNKVLEPVKVDTSFAGITKTFLRGAFVILGSAIENRTGNYDSLSETQNIVGLGTREMLLRNPEAYLLTNGRFEAIVGIYTDDISLKAGEYRYTAKAEISDLVIQSYYNSTTVIDPVHSYYPVNKAKGWGEYQEEITVRNVDYEFIDFRTEDITASLFSLTVVGNTQAYCILGSDVGGLECRYVKEVSPYDILPQVTTLDIPRNIRSSVEEDQEFTLFSGYFPPVGYHLAYDTYRIGSSVIPVFRSQTIPGDSTRFTIYEKMYKSKEVTSGYTPPDGVGIRFSLYIDEE